MDYMTCNEAHELWRITVRRIQQMCKSGDIEGAKKQGKLWVIPRNAVCPSSASKTAAVLSRKKKMPLPIGVSDFKQIRGYVIYASAPFRKNLEYGYASSLF